MERRGIALQRAYYAATSQEYDKLHRRRHDEHGFGLAFMLGTIEFLGIDSVLDVGSGTGFALLGLRERYPFVRAVGIEPSPDQRRRGYEKGIPAAMLIGGDAANLPFADRSFDLVCEFGALHHMPRPDLAVSEMLRVARKAVFICDTNNFGQGASLARRTKQALHRLGCWRLVNRIKTRGRGFTISTGDGVMYSYSVFNNSRQIAARCSSVHYVNTTNAGADIYRTASHVAVLGILRQDQRA